VSSFALFSLGRSRQAIIFHFVWLQTHPSQSQIDTDTDIQAQAQAQVLTSQELAGVPGNGLCVLTVINMMSRIASCVAFDSIVCVVGVYVGVCRRARA